VAEAGGGAKTRRGLDALEAPTTAPLPFAGCLLGAGGTGDYYQEICRVPCRRDNPHLPNPAAFHRVPLSAFANESARPFPFRGSLAWGTACGLVAAIGYSAANGFLRAVAHCDPVWVSAVKSVPTVLLTLPFLFLRHWRGLPVFPEKRVLLALILAALAGQLFGNVIFQWSLGVVGLALSVPLCLVTQIGGSAILARVFLNESLTRRMIVGVLLLFAATCVLSLGAEEASRAVIRQLTTDSLSAWQLGGGLLGVCLSGLAYASLGVVIRRGVTQTVPVSSTLFLVCVAGTISLGALSPLRIGWQGMLQTEPGDFLQMIAAGLCNTVAFFALTKALQSTPVLYVNALGATQATLAAISGVLIFDESPSMTLAAGVVLSIAGILSMGGSRRVATPAATADQRSDPAIGEVSPVPITLSDR